MLGTLGLASCFPYLIGLVNSAFCSALAQNRFSAIVGNSRGTFLRFLSRPHILINSAVQGSIDRPNSWHI